MSATESLVLSGVTVVDTRTGQLTPEQTVVIEGGVIRRIAPTGSLPVETSGGAIDARGKFLVPGFWDMHAHVLDDVHRKETLALMLAHGITGWRQMSGSPKLLDERKQGRLDLGEDAPELLEMPGQILTRANAPSPAASVAEVQAQNEQGANFIKTITVGPETFFASCREARRLGLGYAGHLSLGVSAEDASKAGMTAIEHLGPLDLQLISCSSRGWLIKLILKLRPPVMPDLSPEKMATVGRLIIANPTLFRLQMDPDGLKKSQRLVDSFRPARCRKLGEICLAHGTWQVPTLIRIETMQFAEEPRFAEDPGLRYIPAETRQFWVSVAKQFAEKVTPEGKKTLEAMMQKALEMTKIFDECGVKMLAGSDYGGMWVIPGVSLHQEFDLLAKAGLSPLRVLQMTTLDGAEFLGRQASDGTVEEGKAANLVLLNRNPIESVANLHTVDAVVCRGRHYPTAALNELKETVASHMAPV